MSENRFRTEIIELSTGKTFINVSQAAEEFGISRYKVQKSITSRVKIGELYFAYFSYGMDIAQTQSLYKEDKRKSKEEK